MIGLSRPFVALTLLLAQGCACEGTSPPTTTESDTGDLPLPEPDPPPPELAAAPQPQTSAKRPSRDAYVGWKTWCEPPDWDTPCASSDECTKVLDPTGTPTECATPWWSETPDTKVCLPAWPGPQARQREIDNLRLFVDEICKPPKWWKPGQGMRVGTCWKHDRGKLCDRLCDPDRLHALLVLVATRESTLRPWKRHRLNPDVKANKHGWFLHAATYGWKIELDPAGGIRSLAAARPSANAYYADRHRWQGLGAYGQNAALSIATWDPSAPPEVLCRMEIASEVYLRRLRSAWSKLSSGSIACDGEVFRGSSPEGTPAWVDLHRAASTGRLCPHPRDADFIARAGAIRVRKGPRYELDAFESVDLEGLGSALGTPETQLAAADAVRARFSTR